MVESTELRVMRSMWAVTRKVSVTAGSVTAQTRSPKGVSVPTVASEGNHSWFTARFRISR